MSLTVTAIREEDGTISGYLGVANDLTARKVAEQRFQAAFDRAPAAMAIVDLEGRYVQANDTTCMMLGIPPADLVGRNWLDFVHPDDAERVATSGLRIMLGELDSAPDEMRIIRGDGTMIWAYGDAAVVRDASGTPLYMLGFMADITARKQLEEQLEHEATHDPLTGLPNRLLFRRLAEQDAARAARQGSRVGIVYLDLDGFKHINDTFGHAAGDELLVRVAERLRGSIRAGDSVARLGGDEFALLCSIPRAPTRPTRSPSAASTRSPSRTGSGRTTCRSPPAPASPCTTVGAATSTRSSTRRTPRSTVRRRTARAGSSWHRVNGRRD